MKKSAFFLLLFLFPLAIFAQKPKFEATVDKNSCEVGENIQLRFVTNMQGDLELPELKNCKIVAGPMSEYTMSRVRINGKLTVETNIAQTYIISFTKKGDQVIPPAKFTANGKTYHTQAIHVNVGASTTNHDEAANQNKDLFITISLSKNKVYQGEHVVASYRLYCLYNNVRHSGNKLDFPSPKGFWSQEIFSAKTIEFEQELVNGKKYLVFLIKKSILIPQKTGKLKIDPYKITWELSNLFQSQEFNLVSNSPAIEVIPLPKNAPESFNGAVGNFSFEVNYSKTELKVNDGLDITVKIRGNGNLKFINDFVLDLPEEMEKFDPEISDTINVGSSGMSGTRVFKYLAIPRASGKYKLKPIEFTYFDPETGKYKTLSSAEFELNVLKDDGTRDNTVIKQQGSVKVLNKEIRHLRSYQNDIRIKGDYFFSSPLFIASLLFGPVAFLLFVFIRRKSRKSDSQIEQQRVKRATKVAIRHMQHAKILLDRKDIDGFYSEAMKTLYEYTGVKLGLPNSAFTKENIRLKMEEKNIDAAVISRFVKIIEDCEMARFARHHAGYENQLYDESIGLIENLEDKL